jgi:CHASE2 domain-containing sensor protein
MRQRWQEPKPSIAKRAWAWVPKDLEDVGSSIVLVVAIGAAGRLLWLMGAAALDGEWYKLVPVALTLGALVIAGVAVNKWVEHKG